MDKIDKLFYKTLSDFKLLLEDYNYGIQSDESFIYEEALFLNYQDIGCIKDSYLNSIIEYFLNNDYKTKRFKWM